MWSRSCISAPRTAQREKKLPETSIEMIQETVKKERKKTAKKDFLRQSAGGKVFSDTYHLLQLSAGRVKTAVKRRGAGWKRTACIRAKAPSAKLFYSSVGKTGVCVSAEQGALRVTFS